MKEKEGDNARRKRYKDVRDGCCKREEDDGK